MQSIRRLRDANPLLLDGAVVAMIAVVEVLGLPSADAPPSAYALAVLTPLPLVVRRRWPVAVLAAVLAADAANAVLEHPYPGLGPAMALAAYSVGAHAPRRRSLPAMAGLWTVLTALTASTAWGRIDLVAAVVVTAAAWALGDSHRTRRLTIAALEERTAELELAQSRLAVQAASAERARIARELHDVVAHSISVIAVQSGVGAHLIDTHPAQARQVLTTITEASRQALDELRRMLGVLRDDGTDDLRPAPGLQDLPALVAQAERAGLRITMSVDIGGCDVPDALGLTAYRIVQEALTNVAKHAGPTDVSVRVCHEGGALRIEVRNARTAAQRDGGGAGVGLLGMRERVKLFGGSLEHGEHGGEFRVLARLPVSEAVS